MKPDIGCVTLGTLFNLLILVSTPINRANIPYLKGDMDGTFKGKQVVNKWWPLLLIFLPLLLPLTCLKNYVR